MVHPKLEQHRSVLNIDDAELNLSIKDNMSTAFNTFPVSPLSKAEKNTESIWNWSEL